MTCTYGQPILPGESAPPITVPTQALTPGKELPVDVTVEFPDGTIDDVPANDGAIIPITIVAVPVPTTTTPTTTTTPPTTPADPSRPANQSLARTGSDVQGLVGLGAGLLAAGVVLLTLRRRRRTAIG